MRQILSVLLVCILFSVYGNKKENEEKLKVIVFLGTECPLSVNYTLTLNNLQQQYADKGVQILGVFSFEDDTKSEIDDFVKKYNIEFTVQKDNLYHIADSLNATITPQAFLISPLGEILYSGKIDNWPITLGQRRTVITEYYLQDAIESYFNNKTIEIKKTEAVGCYIHAHMSHGN